MRRKIQIYLLSLVFGLVSQTLIATAIDTGSNPGISTPIVSIITATSSQITWTTGVATTMNYLSYGITSGTYSNTVSIPCSGATIAQVATSNHCVNLINLIPNTTYYYKIPSNTTTSSGSTGQGASVNTAGPDGSFKTLPLSTNASAQPLGSPYLLPPSSVLATTTLANPTLVTISWVNSSSSTTQTRFEITKGTLGGVPTTIASSIPGTARSSTDTVTVAGVYVYGVKACAEDVCSSVVTSIVNISTPSIPVPRSATLSGSSTVQLIWSDTSWNETRFEIYRGGVNITKVEPGTTSYTDTISSLGTYEYSIAACNIFGCSYPQARFTPAITIAAQSSIPVPSPVLSGSFTPATIKPDMSSVFSYTVENARYCQIINTKGDMLFTSTSSSFSSTFSAANYPSGLTAVVTCYNTDGLSTSITKILTVSTTTPSSLVLPGQPTNAYSVVISTSSARLYWGDTQNETMYRIMRVPTGDATPPTLNADTVTYLDTNLLPGITYTYSVQACNTAAGTLTLNCSGAVNAGIITTPKLPVITLASSTLPVASSTVATTTVPVTGISFGDVPAVTSTPPKDTTVVIQPTITTLPSTPLSLTAIRLSADGVLSNSIRISWKSASTNTSNFKLYRSSSNNSLQLPSLDVKTTFFDDVSLLAGSYSYYLSACNEKGCSATINTAIIIVPEIKVEEVTPADTLLSLEISKAVGKITPGTFINIVPTIETATKLGSSKTFTSTASPDGSFSVKVPDGVYTVEGVKPVKVVTLLAGKVTSTTDKIIPKNKIITGVVTLLDGTPVINAEVSAYKKETNEWLTSSTNSSGNYSITTSGGVWNVTVKPKDDETVLWEAVNVLVTAGFSNQDSSETQVANLRVIPFGSNLTITVKDENNNAVPSLLVTLDTSSSMSPQTDTATQVTRKILSQKTGTDGSVTIHIPGGKYFIRVLVPTGFGYNQPDETSVMLTPNENREVPVVLIQESVNKTSKLVGITKFDDGIPTDAFVSAWSNEGGKAEVKTSTDGKFSLDVTVDQTWHIKATKDLLQKSYVSSEQTIVSTTATKSLDLVFVKNDAAALPTTVTSQKSTTEEISVSSDNGAKFTLPANGVISSGKVDITIKPTTEAPSRSASTLVSTAYDITIKNAQGQKLSVLASDAEIIIPYDEKELAAKGVTVESVIPSYYDETLATWISVPKFIINKEKKVFILRVNHLTRFALIALADTTAPTAPTDILAEEIVSAGVKLTWKNPTQDFNHSKIYRSEKLGSSGDLVAAEVFSNSFLDKVSVVGGKIYYYTVRAVDAAGNESSNNNQLAYSAQGSSLAVGTSTTLLLPPGQVSSGLISRQLSLGSTGEDVTALQKALKYDGFYATGPITGYYGKLTQNAVFRFQNYYKAELLIPNGYKKGTGVVGAITAKKINEIIAQETQ